MPTATAPVKQSPAPVVSTTCTNHHPIACLQAILLMCPAVFVTVHAILGQALDAHAEQGKMLQRRMPLNWWGAKTSPQCTFYCYPDVSLFRLPV